VRHYIKFPYADCHSAEHHSADCHIVNCHSADGHHAENHPVEFQSAKCHSALWYKYAMQHSVKCHSDESLGTTEESGTFWESAQYS